MGFKNQKEFQDYLETQNKYYVTCKCGNMVSTYKRHDFSKLPCPECKEKNNAI